nr:DUF882 domain-containing protein [Kofleriaceae bacterium]
MLPAIAQLRTAATLMSLATPAPLPIAPVIEAAIEPVEVPLFDENLNVHARVAIRRDGSTDDATAKELKHLFRCRDTGGERKLAQKTLAMLADVADHWQGKDIEFVSVVRLGAKEPMESPHRDARAIDFRIRGVKLTEIRDYLWRSYTDVGVGWYPAEQFIHMDTRPGLHDTAWTFIEGVNHYHPYWAELARQPAKPGASKLDHKPGV